MKTLPLLLLLLSVNGFAPLVNQFTLNQHRNHRHHESKCLFGIDERHSSQSDERFENPIVVKELEKPPTPVLSNITSNAPIITIGNSEPDTGKDIFFKSLEENAEIAETTFEDNVPLAELHDEIIEIESTNTAQEDLRTVLTAAGRAIVDAEAKFASQSTQLETESATVEEVTKRPISAPSVSKIVTFAVPAIGVWLCGPLLSMIDTSCVGLLSGTAQQAALNPAVAVTDYSALLIAFLYTGTTNLISAARETDATVDGSPRTTSTFRGVLQLSWIVGLGLGGVLFMFAPHLLRAIIGDNGISPAVFDASMRYVRIRALGMPAAAVIGSAQAACLGMQDIRSPLYVLGVAALVNFLGDMAFVGNANPWIGGAAGAAWATVFSQYTAVTMFLYWLCNQRNQDSAPLNLSESIMHLMKSKYNRGSLRPVRESKKERPEATKKDAQVSVRGFLSEKFTVKDFLKAPSRRTIQEFSEYVLPVTSTQIGRVSGYVAMSHVVSSSMGTLSMAAQQIIISLFGCLCPIADSLNLTAQSFLPSLMAKTPSPERSAALRKTSFNFAKAGGIFGAIMLSAVSCIPLLSRFFTTDLKVISLVNSVTPLLMIFFGAHGVVCAMEGVLLGRKDLSFLGKMYSSFFAVVPFFMLRVKKAALAGATEVNLRSVWTVFVGYQMFRLVAWSLRAAQLQWRTEQQRVAP